MKLDIDFLNNCKQLVVHPKFLIFKLRKFQIKMLHQYVKDYFAINKSNKQLQHISNKLSQSETFLSKQLSTIDFYILNRSLASYKKKSLQKLLNTQQKILSLLTKNNSLPSFTAGKTTPPILGVLQNLRRNKDIVITKPNKRSGVLVRDRQLYQNAI